MILARSCLFLLFLCSVTVSAFEGKVISIADGDTLTVLTATKQQIKVRLAGIDTPEKSQAFGMKAKQALSQKVFGKTVEVKSSGKDRYGRTIGNIHLGKRWINLEIVEEGWAWHYKAYSKDRQLAQAEVNARRAMRGLWVDSNPVPPWEFRRGGNERSSKSPKTPDKAITGYWLNESSGVRHNSNCHNYKNTKRGRACRKDEGRAGGCCGG